MRNNIERSKRQRSKLLNQKKQNKPLLQKNIYQLIGKIQKTLNPILKFHSHESHLNYLDNVIFYIKKHYPKEYENMIFDTEKDTIISIIETLNEFLIRNDYIINYYDDSQNEGYVSLMKYIQEYVDGRWYDLSLEGTMLKVKDKKLRIGLAHLLEKAINGQGENHDLVNHTFTKKESGFYDNGLFMDMEDWADINNIPYSYVDKFHNKCRRIKQLYDGYLAKDYNEFLEYQPIDNNLKRLKNIIAKLNEMDFTLFKRFPDADEEGEESLSYTDTLIVFVTQYHPIEIEYLYYFEETLNNYGVRYPCYGTTIKNKKEFEFGKDTEVQEFIDLGNTIYQLAELITDIYGNNSE